MLIISLNILARTQMALSNTLQYSIVVLSLLMVLGISKPVVLNGGQISLTGVITTSQIDITVSYTANVKWLALIWSADEINVDTHLFIADSGNAARPVKVIDAHLDQNSYIVPDDVSNIQPSVTSFTGSLANGLSIAYNRDLNTGDTNDIRLYPNTVIEVCFMSANEPFQGKGYEKGNTKVCSFFSVHDKPIYQHDRLLGNFAGTQMFAGGNITVYGAISTDGKDTNKWLFLGLVHKQQGLNKFAGGWIGVTYADSTSNTDLTLLEYATVNFKLELHARDFYLEGTSTAKNDFSFATLQGNTDVFLNLGGVSESQYVVALYKRKLDTGDTNRDRVVRAGVNRLCFLHGQTWNFDTYTPNDRVCINVVLGAAKSKNFRVQPADQVKIIKYTPPKNKVTVKKDGIRTAVRLMAMLVVMVCCFI